MNKKVSIQISQSQLEVKLTNDSPFLEGMHRIFLANVIGLEESEKESGYFLEKEKGNFADVIIELLEYFEDEGANVNLDLETQKIYAAHEEGKSNFEDARSIGEGIKINPPEDLKVPGFIRTLKPYQVGPVAHLVEVGNAANFSVPGSGKTTVTLAAYAIMRDRGVIDKMVVISPRAAFMSWEDEYKECFGRKPHVVRITGPVTTRRKLYRKAAAAELILISYHMASYDVNRLIAFLSSNKVLLILDESHYIKRMEGGKWSNTVLSIAPLAKRRAILTGTPLPNSLEDLWSQLTFLWPSPKILGTTEQFKDRLSTIPNPEEEIKKDLRPFYWRIHKSQLKLRKPKFHRIDVKMRPYQQAIYDALAVRVLAEVVKSPQERSQLRTWRRARTIRLLQVASNPTLLTEYSEEFKIPPIDATGLSVNELIEGYNNFEVPPKIEAVVKLTKELLERKEKVLIWTSFIHNIKTLSFQLKEFNPRLVYGDIPKDSAEDEFFNREKMIKQFKEDKRYNVLIANPSACAESVSLHKICHHAIYVDRTFNGAQYMQSLDRLHRIGLRPDEQVHYYLMRSANSIDQVIDSRLEEKHKRMLTLLEDDLAVMDLESNYAEMSEESEEENDFAALIEHLKVRYS